MKFEHTPFLVVSTLIAVTGAIHWLLVMTQANASVLCFHVADYPKQPVQPAPGSPVFSQGSMGVKASALAAFWLMALALAAGSKGRLTVSHHSQHHSAVAPAAKATQAPPSSKAGPLAKHDRWIVVTTINYPTDTIRKLAAAPGWKVVVVADLKTPKDWALDNVDLISVEDQKSLHYRILPLLPNNHYGCARPFRGLCHVWRHLVTRVHASCCVAHYHKQAPSVAVRHTTTSEHTMVGTGARTSATCGPLSMGQRRCTRQMTTTS